MKSPTRTFFQNVVRNFAFCGVDRKGSMTLGSVLRLEGYIPSDVPGDDGAVINPFESRLCELTVPNGYESAPGCRTEDSDKRMIVELRSSS